MPKISVIIPVYNVEQYLPKCLESVINQTFKDLEIICINDGSTDSSLDILNQYKLKDPRVKVINQSNKGAGISRNVGIENAIGEYLFFIDADDWIDEHFLENSLSTAIKDGVDIVETTKSYNVYKDNVNKLFDKKNAKGFTANGCHFRRDVIWDKIYKTFFIKEHNITFPNGLCHNDAFFLLQCLYHNAKIALNSDAIYYHNKANETSIRYKPSDKKLLSQLDMFILEIEFMNSHFFNFYDYYHNYHKLFHTAKIKYRYIKDKENKLTYKNKLTHVKKLNKYPHTIFGIIKDFLTSSRFREELKYSKADPKEYPFLLKEWYKKKTKKELNLENPTTFNEKIQWLKLYDSTQEKTILADKYLVREYIKKEIGEEYLVPLLGVWDKFDDIDFDKLPNQFVLKCNHGSGMNLIVKDKSELNIAKEKKKFDYWMRENFGFVKGLQLHYNKIPHKIIAEEYISNNIDKTPHDYKIFCFNGKPKIIQFLSNREQELECTFFDAEWKELNIPYRYKKHKKIVNKPENFEQMVEIAKKLSKPFSFVRIDFYSVNKRVYFSEYTFTPANGILSFPTNYNIMLGEYLNVSNGDKYEI